MLCYIQVYLNMLNVFIWFPEIRPFNPFLSFYESLGCLESLTGIFYYLIIQLFIYLFPTKFML